MRIKSTLVCIGCKRALPRDHFRHIPLPNRPNRIDQHCVDCNRKPPPEPVANDDGTYSLPLSRGMVALIDACDLDLVRGRRWHASDGGRIWYARAEHALYLHRLLMDPADGLVVDHINGDGLDNRRENLRVIAHADNVRRTAKWRYEREITSQYRGVYREVRYGKVRYCAELRHNGTKVFLGRFADEQEAARVRDAKARELFGEFVGLNFPDEEVA